VFVEHGLAVLDLSRQPPCGDGIPALGLGKLAGGVDDESMTRGSLPGTTIFSGHTASYHC
jgi:hypothetical protein